jgi:DNA segregation ATPase FtsK/SpoIIIE, S-DNA-T family
MRHARAQHVEKVGPALRVIYGAQVGRVYPIDGPEWLIGRSAACHIRLDQPSVSRVHAKIVDLGHDHLVVRDCGAMNGTLLEDVAVAEATLRDGARLKVGRTIFEYVARHPRSGGRLPFDGTPPPEGAPSAALGVATEMTAVMPREQASQGTSSTASPSPPVEHQHRERPAIDSRG